LRVAVRNIIDALTKAGIDIGQINSEITADEIDIPIKPVVFCCGSYPNGFQLLEYLQTKWGKYIQILKKLYELIEINKDIEYGIDDNYKEYVQIKFASARSVFTLSNKQFNSLPADTKHKIFYTIEDLKWHKI